MNRFKLTHALVLTPLIMAGCGVQINSSSSASSSSVSSLSSVTSATSSTSTSVVAPTCTQDPNVMSMADFRAVPSIDVSFWHAMGQSNQAIIQYYIDEFKKVFPNVNITQASQGGYPDLESKTAQAINVGVAPTIVQTYPDHVANYLQAQAVVNLGGYICATDTEVGVDLTDFVDSYIAENMQFGSDVIYGLPFNKSTEVFTYNKTRFDQWGITVPVDRAPTWDEVADWAQIAKTQTGKFGFAYDSSSNLFITLTRQWGGAYTKSSGNTVREHVLFDNDLAKAALQYYKDKRTAGLFTLPAEWELSYASDAFKVQDTYMSVGSSAGINYNVPANKEFEIGVLPIPQKAGGVQQVIQQGTNLTILADTTPAQRQAAWLFIKFVTSVENTVHWAMQTGYLPVRKSAFESSTFQRFLGITQPNSSFYLNPANAENWSVADSVYYSTYNNRSKSTNAAYMQLDYMFYDPAFLSSSRVRTLAGLAAEDTILGTMTPAQAITNAYAQLPNN